MVRAVYDKCLNLFGRARQESRQRCHARKPLDPFEGLRWMIRSRGGDPFLRRLQRVTVEDDCHGSEASKIMAVSVVQSRSLL